MLVGTSSVVVTMTTPMTSTNYAVTVTLGSNLAPFTNDGTKLPTLVVTGKTDTTFTVTAYSENDVLVLAPTGGALVDWIAMGYH
jgi:hypothetical protein